MFLRLFIYSCFLILFFSCTVKRGGTPTLNTTVADVYLSIENNYANSTLLKDKKGTLYLLNENRGYKQVLVHWFNGYSSIGILNGNKREIGRWYLYDNKNRLIKRVVYSEEGGSILTIDLFNKKGQLIKRNSYSASF